MSEFKYVPVEPTEKMIHAADSVVELERSEIKSLWSEMLRAAATQPSPERESESEILLDWLIRQISGKEFRRIGIEYSSGCTIDDLKQSMKQWKPSDKPDQPSNGCGVVCQASQDDGIACPDDECDRDNGCRPAQPSDSQAEPGDSEMLDWVIKNKVIVREERGGIYSWLLKPNDKWELEAVPGTDLPSYGDLKNSIKAAMRAEKEGS